jgi:hypothetical protein
MQIRIEAGIERLQHHTIGRSRSRSSQIESNCSIDRVFSD